MDKNINTEEELVREFDSKPTNTMKPKLLILVLVMLTLGVGSGFLIAKGTAGQISNSTDVKNSSQATKGTIIGTSDTATFKDEAEGTLKIGGIEGEGQYHLERPGGKTQFVYLTSSVVDLSLVKDKKIKVWGQTQKAQHAPWLMDVGKIEVLE